MTASDNSPTGSSLVLVVDGSPRRAARISETFSRLGHRIVVARSYEESIDALEAEAFDVVASAFDLGGATALELQELLREVFPEVPFILFGAETTAASYKAAMEGGAVEVVTNDSVAELAGALSKALDQRSGRFQGMVHGLSLVDILQLLHFSRRTATVRVGQRARIHLVDGEVVHAVSDDLAGSTALKLLFEQRSGAVVTAPPEPVMRTIHEPFEALLLDHFHRMDEDERTSERTAPVVAADARRKLAERAGRTGDPARLSSWSVASSAYVTPTSAFTRDDVQPRSAGEIAAARRMRWACWAGAALAGTALPWGFFAHHVVVLVLGIGLAVTAFVVAPLAAKVEGAVSPLLAVLQSAVFVLVAAALATGMVAIVS